MRIRNGNPAINVAVSLLTSLVLLAGLTLFIEIAQAQRPAPTPIRLTDIDPAGEPQRVELDGGKYKLVYKNKAGQVFGEKEYTLGVHVRTKFVNFYYPNGQEAEVEFYYFDSAKDKNTRKEKIQYDSYGNPQERKTTYDHEATTRIFGEPVINGSREKWNPSSKRWEPAPERLRWNGATGKWEEAPEDEKYNAATGRWDKTLPSVTPTPSDSSANRSELLASLSPRDALRSVEFLSDFGKVTVHLPDDLAAGDTVSGTVSISPKGQGEREGTQSAEVLNEQLLDLAGQQVRVGNKRFRWTIPLIENDRGVSLRLREKNQKEIAREELSVMSRRPAVPDSFEFPNLIERGRPFEIRGPFDGDFANTRLMIGGVEVTPLAESPGKLVARNASSSSGVAAIKCDERGVVSQGQLRTIAVKLAAPKLKLLRGEQTTLTVLVTGLKGIKEAAPLTLFNESTEVVSMSGGDRQNFTITPKAQEVNDTFMTERILTGITPGGFTISARLDIRLYDVWLKDTPDKETWFDSATDAFRSGRQLADDASAAAGQGDVSAGVLADEALRQLKRARIYVERAIADGEISQGTAQSLGEAISYFEAQALRIKKQLTEKPAPEAFSRPSPSPPPSSRPSPTPTATVTDGRFEPSQGVWQDDEYFDDKPTKRLTRVGPASWNAELKMVVGRRTALFGIREDRHLRILIRGTTNGTRLTPVRFRFTLFQGARQKVIYEQQRAENSVLLDGPVGPKQPFEASLDASLGIPDGRSFLIDRPGSYRIEGELIRNDGSSTGLKVFAQGEAIETIPPKFRVVPVILSDPLSQLFELEKDAHLIALEAERIEQYLPVQPYSVNISPTAALDLRSIDANLPGNGSTEQERRDSLVAAIGQRFSTVSALTGGETIAVLLSKKDFALTHDPGEAFAYAVSRKVFVIQPNTDDFTFAHEFIHTTPFPWAEEQMTSECGRNYHNKADDNYGNGVSIRGYGTTRRDRVPAIMGASYDYTQWITQCSYWHLLNYLVGSPDPDLLLVRGFLSKSALTVSGSFDKFYELRGETELPKGQRTADGFALILRDNANRVLAEYPFRAVWKIPDVERERTIIPFTYRVETFPGLHRVELVGLAGVLDSKTLSTSPPSVKILTPVSNEVVRPTANSLPVTWSATDADGDSLSYSVYYSPDGGRNWRLVSYEQTGNSFVIPIRGRPRDARVRVIATDGARSSTDEIGFSFER
ncbi:MAG: hypothetical protein ND895_07670 [Pyrinomonadaceae bacterium]|nr:hypothetical protein [Pyrinomonadaceae bacterium]